MQVISLQSISTLRHGVNELALSAVVEDQGVTTLFTINSDHPNWDLFQNAIRDFTTGAMDNSALARIFMENSNLSEKAASKLVKVGGILDGRMTIEDNRVLIDHAPIDTALEGHILRLLRGDGTPKDARNWNAFAKFVENLYSNTSEFVREQLFAWLNYENFKGQGFTLTDDGCFLGYKGCAGTAAAPVSINHGSAIVNGVSHSGAIPNPVGAIVEMPRHLVQADPSVGCSAGLHVGTHAYADNWQRGVLLLVKVNPRDVVSVPTECDAQKIRTCRYEVLEVVKSVYSDLTWGDDEADEDTQVGDTISFSYTRKDGVSKDYTITVSHSDSRNVSGTLASGEPRTFIRSRMVFSQAADTAADTAAPAAPAAAPQAAPAPQGASDDSALQVGNTVRFSYIRKDGVKKDYEGEVQYVDSDYLDIVLSNDAGFRTFLRDKVSHVAGVEAEDASADAAPQADAQDAKADYGNPLVNTLMGALQALVNAGFSDEDEPGDEVEEEIRRNGYGTDSGC